MVKNIVNPIVVLQLGILIVATTITVPGVEAIEPGPVNVESIVPEKNPWIGIQRYPSNLAQKVISLTPGWSRGPGWIKKVATPLDPKPEGKIV